MTTTLEAIQAKMKKLQAQADALATKKFATVLKTIHELMDKHDLTIADIDAAVRGKQRTKQAVAKTGVKKSAAAAKYRNPKTGATWSGHGRAPSWIAAAKNRERFLVDGSTAAPNPASAGKAKAVERKTSKTVGPRAGQRKGPQPALFRDPKSGATWSGRGRAPAWIAGAKDRAKFLIDGGTGDVAVTKTSEPKAVTKKPATKTAG